MSSLELAHIVALTRNMRKAAASRRMIPPDGVFWFGGMSSLERAHIVALTRNMREAAASRRIFYCWGYTAGKSRYFFTLFWRL